MTRSTWMARPSLATGAVMRASVAGPAASNNKVSAPPMTKAATTPLVPCTTSIADTTVGGDGATTVAPAAGGSPEPARALARLTMASIRRTTDCAGRVLCSIVRSTRGAPAIHCCAGGHTACSMPPTAAPISTSNTTALSPRGTP